jgi:hypothetical protein
MAFEPLENRQPSERSGASDGSEESAANGVPRASQHVLWQCASDSPKRIGKERVAELAAGQFGRVTWAQLRRLGAAEATVNQWVASGYLIRVMPRVYAVGNRARSQEADLFEAILFAGPNATLSHGTAAWWRGLIDRPVRFTHISTPRRISSSRGLKIHGRRDVERQMVSGLPVTTVPQTMLDLAATETMTLVRRALARLDFTGEFRPLDLYEATGSGCRGTEVLARAISNHLPELAQTRSELEVEFLLLCERYGIPIPQMNRPLHNVRPDAWWPEFDLVAELDGDANHRTPAQRTKDRRKEVILREHGLNVVRYDYDLTMRSPAAVRDDLLRHMGLEPAKR